MEEFKIFVNDLIFVFERLQQAFYFHATIVISKKSVHVVTVKANLFLHYIICSPGPGSKNDFRSAALVFNITNFHSDYGKFLDINFNKEQDEPESLETSYVKGGLTVR